MNKDNPSNPEYWYETARKVSLECGGGDYILSPEDFIASALSKAYIKGKEDRDSELSCAL